jgi:TolB protein
MLNIKYINLVNQSSLILFLFFLVGIFVCSTAAGSPVVEDIQVTNGVNENSPAWSPDGKKLVYASDQDIWISNADGSGSRKLYSSMSWDGDPVFFDSNSILFASEQVDAFSSRFISIHRIGIDGVGRRQLTTNADSREPALSPERDKIAYISRIGNDYDIWVMAADGSSKVRLTDGKGDERRPSWSPDGKYVFYSYGGNIFRTDASGVKSVKLTNDSFKNTYPAVSPDGAWIAFVSNRSGNHDIWLTNADGKGTLQLTSDKGIQKDPSWSPDGKRIAYVSDARGEFNIRVMTLDGNLSISEQIEQEEKDIEEDSESSALQQVLTENPAVVIGAAVLVLFVFAIIIVPRILKRLGFL